MSSSRITVIELSLKIHLLSFLYHGLQIIKHGKIVDYTEGNEVWREVMADNSEKWENYAKFNDQLFHQLLEEFKTLLPTWEKIKDTPMDPRGREKKSVRL
jgi:myo-inositol catabolism protein IolC